MIENDPVELAAPTRDFVVAFLERLGLDTGVFDFAVDPHGATVFFECNPDGQWGALERNNGDPIASLFAAKIASICAQ